WQILRQRYLKVSPTRSYRNLIDRLGACVTLRQKIRTWVSLCRTPLVSYGCSYSLDGYAGRRSGKSIS
ncbi:MAG: hypothetical protein EWV91_09920, partial [Microcystis aeruginosa Ma_QC_Ca_00000000_S207]